MSRIERAYRERFRATLGQMRARQIEQGLARLARRAETLAARENLPTARALARIDHELQSKLRRWQIRTGALTPGASPPVRPGSAGFLCDAGLGGLARWIRAAGYDAHWIPDVADDVLLKEAIERGTFLLTTDSLLLERRDLRAGRIPALWLPPSLTPIEQLRIVVDELELPCLDPRCMRCGGALVEVEKEAARDRIPPRTYLWRHEFYECTRCGKLYWHGTHWLRIQEKLRQHVPG